LAAKSAVAVAPGTPDAFQLFAAPQVPFVKLPTQVDSAPNAAAPLAAKMARRVRRRIKIGERFISGKVEFML